MTTPLWSKKFSAARYCVVCEPPENDRLWFWVRPVWVISSPQSVLAVPSCWRAVVGRLPLAICDSTKLRYSPPFRYSSLRAGVAAPTNVSYSSCEAPDWPFLVSMSTTPLAPREP
jgi:hypothetical protein